MLEVLSALGDYVPLMVTIVTILATSISNRRDIRKQVEDLSKKLSEHIRDDADDKAEQCRVRILRFDDELYDKNRPWPGEGSFLQMRHDCDKYKSYVIHKKQLNEDFQNGIGEDAMDHIQEAYIECRRNGLFGKAKQ